MKGDNVIKEKPTTIKRKREDVLYSEGILC